MGRRERRALRERVPRVVVCHARELGAIGRRGALPSGQQRPVLALLRQIVRQPRL